MKAEYMKAEYKELSLWEALAVIQREAPEIKKTESVDAGTIKYSFAGFNTVWNAVSGLMDELGFVWSCATEIERLDGGHSRFILRGTLYHLPSGEKREAVYPLAGDTPQKIGSGMTYGRRYLFVGLLNLRVVNDDDDAQKAEENAQLTPSQQAQAGRTPRKPSAQRAPARPRQAPPQTADVAPGGAPDGSPNPSGPMTERQRGAFFASLKGAGYDTREKIMPYVNAVLADADPELAPVTSSQDLTFTQAGWVIERASKGWIPSPEKEG